MIVREKIIMKVKAFITGGAVSMPSKKIFTPVRHNELLERLVCD